MIGILGGTGPQGRGLAARLARGGQAVVVGSRTASKAEEVASKLSAEAGVDITGGENQALARQCRTLLVCVPYDGLTDTLEPLADVVDGQVVISVVNPLSFAGGGPAPVSVPAGSAAQAIAELLPRGRVTTAFNNLSATNLTDSTHNFDEDVLVCGDDEQAVGQTIDLVERIVGLRGVAVGPLRHAATVEALTAVLIGINRANTITAGVRITGFHTGS